MFFGKFPKSIDILTVKLPWGGNSITNFDNDPPVFMRLTADSLLTSSVGVKPKLMDS